MSNVYAGTLLNRAHAELDQAQQAQHPAEQFFHAHMAALRAGAAVVALMPGPDSARARGKVRSVWEQLAEVGPRWAPWVEFYRASAITRAALEAGQVRQLEAVDSQHAIDAAGQFLALVGDVLSQQAAEFGQLARAS